MTEQNGQVFIDLYERLLLFLDRPVVQIQLIAIIITMVITWFLSKGLTHLIHNQFAQWVDQQFSGKFQRYVEKGLMFLDHVTFPLMGILTLHATQYIFLMQNWLYGLLNDFILLYWVILTYRLFIAILYQIFENNRVSRFHYRLIAPLFYIFIAVQILADFADLNELYEFPVLTFPENPPVTLGGVFLATVGLYFWIDAVWGVQEILQNLILKFFSIDPGVVEGTLTVLQYLLIGAGLFVALNNLGLDSTTVAAVTGGLSVGVGFALQDVLKNFLGGILLLFEGSMRPGDVVKINDTLAVVDKLSVRSTTVRSYDNTEMIIPNQNLVSSAVTTYTGNNSRIRLDLMIGVSYDSNPKQVLEVLRSCAEAHELVLIDPPPITQLVGFGNNSIDFALRVWVDNLNFGVKFDLHLAIWEAFEKHGIEMPFPQRDLHIRSGIPWETLGLKHNFSTDQNDTPNDDTPPTESKDDREQKEASSKTN